MQLPPEVSARARYVGNIIRWAIESDNAQQKLCHQP